MRKVTKGNVTIKLWDLGGQPRFRSMWERYCRAVSAIVYGANFLFPFDYKTLSLSPLLAPVHSMRLTSLINAQIFLCIFVLLHW